MMICNNITLYIMHLLGLEANSFPSLALAHKSITLCEDKKWVRTLIPFVSRDYTLKYIHKEEQCTNLCRLLWG